MKPTGKKKVAKETMAAKVFVSGYCQNCKFYKRPRCTLNKSVVTRKCSCAEYQSVVKGK